MKRIKIKFYSVLAAVFFLSSCQKYVDIAPPISNLTAGTAFETESDIRANIAGIHSYNLLQSSYHDIYRHLYPAYSADEILYYTGNATIDQFVTNSLLPENTTMRYMWSEPYKSIYQSNLILEALDKTTSVNPALISEAKGVAHFFRALSYINLTSLYGDVPLIVHSDVSASATQPRASKKDVLNQAIDDLKKAKEYLSGIDKGNVWVGEAAATALLARAYLYNEQWQEAANEASILISGRLSSKFALENIQNVFVRGTKEAIFSISTDGGSRVAINHTYNGRTYIPSTSVRVIYHLTPDFLNAFEPGDLRQTNWIKQFTLAEPKNWYPNKYKLRAAPSDASLAEDQILIRLAEIYLIRAEANAQLDNTAAALTDLNAIRTRAGLPELANGLSKSGALLAIEQERRVELFCEYGHRWVDLVRTGRADAVLGPHKQGTWQSYGQLYPVPAQDIELNPGLTQNPGYNVQ